MQPTLYLALRCRRAWILSVEIKISRYCKPRAHLQPLTPHSQPSVVIHMHPNHLYASRYLSVKPLPSSQSRIAWISRFVCCSSLSCMSASCAQEYPLRHPATETQLERLSRCVARTQNAHHVVEAHAHVSMGYTPVPFVVDGVERRGVEPTPASRAGCRRRSRAAVCQESLCGGIPSRAGRGQAPF